MRRQRLPLSALDTDDSRPLLFYQQSLMSAAEGKAPVQVIFPDNTTSIAVPVSSVRDGFIPGVPRRSTTDEEDTTSTVLDDKEDIILVLTGSREGDQIIRSRVALVFVLMIFQLVLVGMIYSGEMPSDWSFSTRTGMADYKWLLGSHLVFTLGIFTRSLDILAVYSALLALTSLYVMMGSIDTAMDIMVLSISILLFLLTRDIRNLIGPQCMYSSNRSESL